MEWKLRCFGENEMWNDEKCFFFVYITRITFHATIPQQVNIEYYWLALGQSKRALQPHHIINENDEIWLVFQVTFLNGMTS